MNDQAAASKPFDPYDQPPPWYATHEELLTTLAVAFLTVLLTVLSFPPFHLPEFAYAFASPAVFWAYRRPSFKRYAYTILGSNAVAWIIILSWLHHVTWVGLALLGMTVGAWIGVWYLAVWWVMPRLPERSTPERMAAVFGLAALWVVVEWTRTWFLGGFPWLPLSASQWQRVSILQIAAYTGAYGVSFVLISMNIGFAAYAHRLFKEGRAGLKRRSPEFLACLFLLVLCTMVFLQESLNRGQFAVPLGRVVIVQPDVPQSIKWDPAEHDRVVSILEQRVERAGRTRPDLMLLPEACTPLAIKGDEAMQEWVEKLVSKSRTPLLLGSMAIENQGTPKELWYNAAFLVRPDSGVQPDYYAKRHLVPFGEYVPLRPILGWLDKVTPVGDDFNEGVNPSFIPVKFRKETVPVSPLICYEDVFPDLARDSVRAGGEVLVVLSNSAWYGKSAAAEQHVTHSVLRAIETRRPVLRCGNNGWSGWIDEFGSVREVISGEKGIFIRANLVFEVTRDSRWIRETSFYTRHGDWFVGACAALALFAWLLIRINRADTPEPATES